MSVSRQQQTSMNDSQSLCEALKAKGFTATTQEPATIRGHAGEHSQEKCEIVCRLEDNKRRADIGFAKGEDGNYTLVTDTWVNKDLQDMPKFVGELKVEYVKAQARKLAKKGGLTFLKQSTLPNGKIRLQYAAH